MFASIITSVTGSVAELLAYGTAVKLGQSANRHFFCVHYLVGSAPKDTPNWLRDAFDGQLSFGLLFLISASLIASHTFNASSRWALTFMVRRMTQHSNPTTTTAMTINGIQEYFQELHARIRQMIASPNNTDTERNRRKGLAKATVFLLVTNCQFLVSHLISDCSIS